jgi:SWI/SNF-related matrix-associated actin-dependent regulator 1 of chromatin subfamily A
MSPSIPRDYQKQGVRAIEAFGLRALLADDTGLGKTLQALHVLRRNPAALPALVVCPATVKRHWERNAGHEVGMRAAVLDGTRPSRPGLVKAPIYILNYDIAPAWIETIAAHYGIKMLLLDECHRAQNARGIQTQALRYLARQTPYMLAMSATPMTNRPAELWPVLNMLRPDAFPSFLEFATEYCLPRRRFGKWDFSGCRRGALPKLNKVLLETCMVRRLKEDVLHELPRKMRKVVHVPMTNMEDYREAKNDFKAWLLKNKGAGKARRAMRAEKFAQLAYLRQICGRGKVRAIYEWVDNFLESGEKLVGFTVHTKLLDALCRRYEGICVRIDGAVTGHKRELSRTTFMEDPRCRLLFGHYQAAGTGLDGLQRVCRTAAVFELGWRPGDMTQAEDRVYRYGQEKTSWIYYLISGGTIEERMCELIQEKQANIRGALDGEGKQITDDLDILDQLIEYLETEER